MKKILTCLLAAALIASSLSSCNNTVKSDTIEELSFSYESEDYYDEQIIEIDEIINDYTAKINSASDKAEIENLKKECIDKINEVEKKEEALIHAKTDAENFLESVKDLLIPYETALKYVKTLNENKDVIQNAETPAEINKFIDELKKIVNGSSNTGTYIYNQNNISVEYTFEYSKNENGLPVLTIRCSQPFETDIGSLEGVQIDVTVNPSGSVDKIDDNTLMAYSTLRAGMGSKLFRCENTPDFYYEDDPSVTGYTIIDENTLKLEVMTVEEIASISATREEYLSQNKYQDDGYTADFIAVNVIIITNYERISFRDYTEWIILL